MIKLLIGGSPCTHWSIAQTKNRETEPSGMGWELFENYLIALDKFKPDYFLYENNKSMSKAIRNEITNRFGFEPICINSALVSAQNRQRLYWCGKRNFDGTYSCVEVEQPKDKGILLRDILESGVSFNDKAYTLTTRCAGAIIEDTLRRHRHTMCAEPVNVTLDGKAHTLKAQYYKSSTANMFAGHFPASMAAEPVNVTLDGKSQCLRATYYKDGIRNLVGNNVDRKTCIAEPVRIGTIESETCGDWDSKQYRVYSPDGKSVTLCGQGGGVGAKTGLYAVPWEVSEATKLGYTTINPGERVDLAQPNSKTRRGRRMSDKSNCLTTSCEFYEYCGTSVRPIYRVEKGTITINGKQFPIKLVDGYYIIRKLTVTECKRLQTVPDNYVFPVSNTQAYKMLGNGWTVDVISHILSHCPGITAEPLCVLSMYDGMACGHIALDNLGANIHKYWATEIDKYAIKTACYNFPDIIQLGDAFQVRQRRWNLKV